MDYATKIARIPEPEKTILGTKPTPAPQSQNKICHSEQSEEAAVASPPTQVTPPQIHLRLSQRAVLKNYADLKNPEKSH
jgi:hypothetical protein